MCVYMCIGVCVGVYMNMCIYMHTHTLYIRDRSIYLYIFYIYKCVYTDIYTHTYMVKFQKIYWISQKCFHCYGMVGFKRPYFKSEILAKSQPITILRRWATLNQTQSTFQRLPVQNNKYFTLNRALTSHMVRTGGWNGIGKSCTFLWRFADRKG